MSSDEEDIFEVDFIGAEDEMPPEEKGEDDDDAIGDDVDNFEDLENEMEKHAYSREIIIIKPENRKTSNRLTLAEQTALVSARAMHIEIWNNCQVDSTGLVSSQQQAQRELMMRKCPLNVRRGVGEMRNAKGEIVKYFEDFCPNDMIFAVEYKDVL